jgi:hypothetical protein
VQDGMKAGNRKRIIDSVAAGSSAPASSDGSAGRVVAYTARVVFAEA